MPDTFVSQVHEHCRNVRSQCERLNALADAFDVTGNPTVADTLYAISSSLFAAQEELYAQQGAETTRQLRQAQEGAAETLRFALAYAAKESAKPT